MRSAIVNHAAMALLIVMSTVVTSIAEEPAWTTAADRRPAMTAEETVGFMKRLTRYVVEHHLKTDPQSAQKGMIYEYYWVAKDGTPQQWIQGEALDTMHDGAWFCCALANAYLVTGDAYFKDVLIQGPLPFYLQMLNHSDSHFTAERNDARPENHKTWTETKEWLLQGREAGFVPYWWDDGASVSLEQLRDKRPVAFYPCRNELAGRPNPDFRLSGYSLGSSNHLAQDLGVMLETVWLMLRRSDAPDDRKLADETARAARHLQDCRTRHGNGNIPAVAAAAGLTNDDESLLRKVPEDTWAKVFAAENGYRRMIVNFEPGRKYITPGFADDQQYRYYASLARQGTLNEPVAWRTAYDAFTEGRIFDAYYDDAPRPPGINRFDLYPVNVINGKPEHVRSQRLGPFKAPVPVGSRMGPQNMVCCGWALQALAAYPNAWDKVLAEAGAEKLGLHDKAGNPIDRDTVVAWLRRELGGGLRTWEAVFDEYGYIPTGIGSNTVLPGIKRDAFSDSGGYAHLLSAAAQWVNYLEGRRDWELLFARTEPTK
jgi:hypothetical protein